MKASDILKDKIRYFEGVRLNAYRDQQGKPTIGIGHTAGVYMGMSITESQAKSLFDKDIKIYEDAINGIPEADTQGKFDALVDFSFNCGIGNLLGSTLMKKIRAKAPYEDIKYQFMRWVYIGKIKSNWQERRRAWDAQRWLE